MSILQAQLIAQYLAFGAEPLRQVADSTLFTASFSGWGRNSRPIFSKLGDPTIHNVCRT